MTRSDWCGVLADAAPLVDMSVIHLLSLQLSQGSDWRSLAILSDMLLAEAAAAVLSRPLAIAAGLVRLSAIVQVEARKGRR